MLYLNLPLPDKAMIPFLYLTLTSVVFEYGNCSFWTIFCKNLTLTSVVFELKILVYSRNPLNAFNFNKCCIWIEYKNARKEAFEKFNFNKCCIWMTFEILLVFYLGLFNFNKCCIWILYIAGTFTAGNI